MLHPSPHPYESHEPVVELRGVTCGYGGVPAVEHANLKIARGDFVGLLGPSGSGKTTLLKTILGSADVYEGEVLVDGRPIKERPPTIGYVPQLETIDWEFPVTVEQVVMMGMIRRNRFFPRFRKEEKEHAYSIMERLGIADFGKSIFDSFRAANSRECSSRGRWSATRPCFCWTNRPTEWTSRPAMR